MDYFAQHITDRWSRDKMTGEKFTTPQFHKELWELLKMKRDTVCIVPRGFGKTTAVSKIGVLHKMLYQTEAAILLVMPEGLGEEVVGDIRFELENNKIIRRLFGDLIPGGSAAESGKKWRMKQLQLTNGCELETITKGQPIRGKRPTLIILDDPQEVKDVKNPEIAEAWITWFNTALMNTLNPLESAVFILATIISDNCLANVIKNNADSTGFKVVQYTAIKDFDTLGFDGELLWPARWTKEMLIERDKKIHRPNFLQEFQNIALPFTGRFVFENKEMPTIIEPIGHYGIFSVFKDITDEDYFYKQLHFGFDFSDGKANNDFQFIDGRNESGQLVFQCRIRCTQTQLVKDFDELITWIRQVNKKFKVALNPEVNYGKVFMDRSRTMWWYRLMRSRQEFDGFTKKQRPEPGWHTGGTTKPLLIACVQDYIDHKFEVSKVQFDEIGHYVLDEHGGSNAQAGWHDDSVIAAGTSLLSVQRGSPSDLTDYFGQGRMREIVR